MYATLGGSSLLLVPCQEVSATSANPAITVPVTFFFQSAISIFTFQHMRGRWNIYEFAWSGKMLVLNNDNFQEKSLVAFL